MCKRWPRDIVERTGEPLCGIFQKRSSDTKCEQDKIKDWVFWRGTNVSNHISIKGEEVGVVEGYKCIGVNLDYRLKTKVKWFLITGKADSR